MYARNANNPRSPYLAPYYFRHFTGLDAKLYRKVAAKVHSYHSKIHSRHTEHSTFEASRTVWAKYHYWHTLQQEWAALAHMRSAWLSECKSYGYSSSYPQVPNDLFIRTLDAK